jgi:hypothetical protein
MQTIRLAARRCWQAGRLLFKIKRDLKRGNVTPSQVIIWRSESLYD